MRGKWKIGLALAAVAVAIAAFWLWPFQEPVYEGKRLSQWLDEGLKLAPWDVYSRYSSSAYSPSVERVVRAVQAIGTNAIPFLLRDMERTESPWLQSAKTRAYKMKLMDQTEFWSWRLNRSVWGFQALGTNGTPALGRLLAVHDGEGAASGSAGAALVALGPFAVPELEKRLHSTNIVTRRRAAGTLAFFGPTAEPAIPALLALLEDTNREVREKAVGALSGMERQPERLVPVFRDLMGDSNGLIRIYAASGLGRFGLSAKAAIPDLVKATNDPDPNIVIWARRALEQIESEVDKSASR